MEIIKSENLKYEYVQTSIDGEKTVNMALDGVNITIEKGSFVSILGHNGSGKSTFAKNINALLIPTEGTIYVNGLNTKQEENVWEIRKNCGMVFQNPDNQIVATIVEDDVAFGLENLGVPSEEIRKRVDDAMKWVGIDDFATTSPTLLSGGQKQRVAIAGILAMKPQCIVFDEPTAMLDPIGRKEVINTAKMLNKEEGITIVLITHYMEETIDSDRVIVMKNGKVAIDGTPKTVFSEVEKMEELGLTVPSMTKIAYNLNKLGLNIPKDILTIDEMVEEICQYK